MALKLVRNHRGQLTIFFAFSSIVLLSALAFIVNVGLFVKAKINLQNAVDAAAWSGAAVQARQLSKIGYLNWEMRNVFKEWMYKYYILGQLSNTSMWGQTNDTVDFRLPNFSASETVYDEFNIPSVCIHFSGTTNICSVYSVPGLPRFEDLNLPGYAETTTSFLNTLVASKGKDCALRAQLNYAVTHAWAYGVDNSTNALPNLPIVATDRPGAWPKAFELAIRIRNLEKLVNSPPLSGGICNGNCAFDITDINQDSYATPPQYERTMKAFLAAKKNLGSEVDMYNSFKLYELEPQPIDLSNITSLNRVLYGDSENEKHYLDLHINIINFATFYTLFVPVEGSYGSTALEAQCAGSKMAIPIPLYPLGFYKNPSVMTYYAVKGEAEFVGLFNPFTNNGVVTLEAYSAAKPFGGRIGPIIFDPVAGESLKPRTSGMSASYLSAIDLGLSGGTSYEEGYPLPIDPAFWVAGSSDTVGGWPGNGELPQFGIPNLIFDVISDMGGMKGTGSDSVQIVKKEGAPATSNSTYAAGLYTREQYLKFAGDLNPGNASSATITPELNRMRKPTSYEGQNYLIPNIDTAENLEAMGVVKHLGGAGTTSSPARYQILAPLWGPNTLYSDQGAVIKELENFLSTSDQAIEAYIQSLLNTAKAIYAKNTLYEDAARNLHDNFDNGADPTCASIAGQYYHFFTGAGTGPCTTSLAQAIEKYFNDSESEAGFINFYIADYVEPDDPDSILSAYAPGPNQGASADGNVTHPWSRETSVHRRNFYSTKFVSLKSLSGDTAQNGYGVNNFSLFSEGDTALPSDLPSDFNSISNPLISNQFPDSIFH